MSSYVSTALRRLVAERAAYLCEYCLLHEEDTFFGCEVDHEVTARILDFNHPDRVLERQTVQALGRYPSAAAVMRMTLHT